MRFTLKKVYDYSAICELYDNGVYIGTFATPKLANEKIAKLPKEKEVMKEYESVIQPVQASIPPPKKGRPKKK